MGSHRRGHELPKYYMKVPTALTRERASVAVCMAHQVPWPCLCELRKPQRVVLLPISVRGHHHGIAVLQEHVMHATAWNGCAKPILHKNAPQPAKIPGTDERT